MGKTPEKESQLILLIDDDVTITEGLAMGLEREGRSIITCNDVESAQLIVERLKPSHIVADVRISGPFGFEGLDFIRHAKRYSPESRVILMTGDAPEALQLEAAERGAVAFLSKPFEVQALDSVLDMMTCSVASAGASHAPLIRMPLLDEIILSDSLRPLFQPIVALDEERRHMGYEALARYRSDSFLRNPDVLYEYAARKQRVPDLEMASVARSLETGASLAARVPLFLNVHPHALASGTRFRDTVIDRARVSQVPLDRIVLEITEQASLTDNETVLGVIGDLEKAGIRFAFDDVGVAYSHLPFIGRVRPSFLKISQHFGTAFETDPTKVKIVSNLLSLARDFNCVLILEGIENESTAVAARELNIHFGQGFLFSHPAEAASFH